MNFRKCNTENTKYTTAYLVYHEGECVGIVSKLAVPNGYILDNGSPFPEMATRDTRREAAQMLIQAA